MVEVLAQLADEKFVKFTYVTVSQISLKNYWKTITFYVPFNNQVFQPEAL